MTGDLQRFDEAREYWSEEGCYILELSNSCADEICSIARARVPAGGTTEPHKLADTVERYVILQGQGLVSLDGGAAQPVAAMDVVTIPEATSQTIANTGSEDLVFLCVCTPRFVQANYQTLD